MSEDSLSIDAVIRFLRQWKGNVQENGRQLKMLEKELREKEDELHELRCENDRLSKQVNEVQTDYRVVNDDYKALIQIMDRARRLAFLAEEDEELKLVSKWMPTAIWNELNNGTNCKNDDIGSGPSHLRYKRQVRRFCLKYLFYI